MFSRLTCGLLNLLRHVAVPVHCPKCGHHFKPFANHTFTHFSEIMGRFPCPRCGHRFGVGEDRKSVREDRSVNPAGPIEQPAETRIERREPSEHELLFYIPPAGRSGGLLFFGFVWSAAMFPTFYLFVINGWMVPLGAKAVISLFTAIGVGMLYAAMRQKFASHLIYLSPERVRMQRSLFIRSNTDLVTAEIVSVKKVEIYSQNGVPVYGIEISAGLRQIRLGSALREEEKNWLAWEIRDFLRNHGATQIPPEAASGGNEDEDGEKDEGA